MKKLFIIGFAALLLVAFTVPAMAKVKIGGIIFTDFYYVNRDKDNAKRYGVTNKDDPTSYNVTALQLPSITRLNGRWTNEDNVGMFIEFGIGQTASGVDNKNDDGVTLRHAYGWWDVNPAFQIMAGKSTTPFSPLNPSQMMGTRSGSVNIIGVGYGNFYAGRFTQVRGTFKFGKMGRVAIALVDPNGKLSIGSDPVVPVTLGTNNTKIPRIDVGVPLYFGAVSLYPSFCYQHQSYDGTQTPGPNPAQVDNNVTSWIGSLGLKAGFGGFGIAVEGNYGQNWANMRGLFGGSSSANASIGSSAPISGATLDNNNNINDAKTWAYWIDLSYKLGPVTPHLLWGQQRSENQWAGTSRDVRITNRMVGLSIPITLAKGFSIRPEFMWYDDGETDSVNPTTGVKDEFGSYGLYGVQFQITF